MDTGFSRRHFLQLGAAGAAAAVLRRAAPTTTSGPAVPPSTTSDGRTRPATGRAKLTDIDHVVIFFQENRSFDQYFGTRPGVLGFGDPNVVKGESGRPAWYQPTPSHPDGYLLPFRLDSRTTQRPVPRPM